MKQNRVGAITGGLAILIVSHGVHSAATDAAKPAASRAASTKQIERGRYMVLKQ